MGEGVERDAFGVEIVGADDGRVPPGVAAADPPLFQHRDPRDAVRLREIVGRGEAMAAAAEDDRVVGLLRFGRAPGGLPASLAGKAFLQQRQGGIASGHGVPNELGSGVLSIG